MLRTAKESSPPLGKKTDKKTEQSPRIVYGWKPFVYLVVGLALGGIAAFLAYRFEIGPKLALDFKGARVEGNAERMEDGVYRLRYKHPSGAIYGRMHRGSFGVQRYKDEKTPIAMAYAPDEPGRFQPVGLSYVPGGIAVALFLASLALVLRARQLIMRSFRKKRP
jgi:hypothetical protein